MWQKILVSCIGLIIMATFSLIPATAYWWIVPKLYPRIQVSFIGYFIGFFLLMSLSGISHFFPEKNHKCWLCGLFLRRGR